MFETKPNTNNSDGFQRFLRDSITVIVTLAILLFEIIFDAKEEINARRFELAEDPQIAASLFFQHIQDQILSNSEKIRNCQISQKDELKIICSKDEITYRHFTWFSKQLTDELRIRIDLYTNDSVTFVILPDRAYQIQNVPKTGLLVNLIELYNWNPEHSPLPPFFEFLKECSKSVDKKLRFARP